MSHNLCERVLPKAWYAVRVRSRFEQVVSTALREKGYEEFVPLVRSRRRWSDRVKELRLPLFRALCEEAKRS